MLNAILSQLGDADLDRAPPPVHLWDPPYCGEMDLRIRRDGTWVHEGAPMTRARLVRLFSTILRREGDDFFLVTPAEKVRITVEDAPFVAVALDASGEGDGQTLRFTTNVGDQATAGPDHRLWVKQGADSAGPAPYIHIRAGLNALLARPVYYELAERVCEGPQGRDGVWSQGVFFPLTGDNEE